MAVQAERALHFAHVYSWERLLTALYGCIAAAAVAVGVLGLLGASGPRQMLESWIDIHALFGLLLCSLVISRCRWRVKHSPRMLPADIRELSRHLSRIVYLLLYVVIGVRQLIGILNSIWHGGAFDFNLFDDHFRNGPDRASWNPKDDFQLFLAAGLFALIFIRVLAFRLWLRAIERAALPGETTGIDANRASKPS
jgi:cytochrome b561